MKELISIKDLRVEIEDCDNKKQLFELAEKIASQILDRVVEIQNNIDHAKELNYEAENTSTDIKNILSRGFFGKSAVEKRSELNTRINSLQNEAISDLNTMMQHITKLTMVSSYFSRELAKFLSQAMEKGFKDSHGQIQICDSNIKGVIQNVINLAEQAALEQADREEKANIIEANKEQINKNLRSISKIEINLENKNRIDDEQSKDILDNSKNIAYNKRSISKNTDAIGIINEKMNKKDLLDDEQSREIADIKSIMLEKSELDKEQEQSIAELQKQIQKLNAELERINKNSNNKTSILAIVISIFALVISIFGIINQ